MVFVVVFHLRHLLTALHITIGLTVVSVTISRNVVRHIAQMVNVRDLVNVRIPLAILLDVHVDLVVNVHHTIVGQFREPVQECHPILCAISPHDLNAMHMAFLSILNVQVLHLYVIVMTKQVVIVQSVLQNVFKWNMM
jgi:hypothetical protein